VKPSKLLLLCAGLACAEAAEPGVIGTDTALDRFVCPTEKFSRIGQIESDDLDEVSGVLSLNGELWVHNDSGDSARVFVLDRTGGLKRTIELNVAAVDIEDISVGPGPDGQDWIWLADVGNNQRNRNEVALYGLDPASSGTVDPTVKTLHWDDPQNVEAFFFDPNGQAWFLTKGTPVQLVKVQEQLEVVADLTELGGPLAKVQYITGADRVGDSLAVRAYGNVFLFPWLGSALNTVQGDPCRPDGPGELQGEAIGIAPDGLFSIPEGNRPPVHFLPWVP